VQRLAKIAVFSRPGFQPKREAQLIPLKPMPISASAIRARVRRGESADGLVPPAVASYIAGHRLYT
jgi:nicotinic acid mononucleotide adenylyltransferase